VPDITIEAGGAVNLSGFATVQTNRFGPGDPPAVTVRADSIRVENGAAIALFNQYEGPGGSLVVEGQHVELVGVGNRGGAVGATGLLAQGLFHPDYLINSIDPAVTTGDSGTITVRATGPKGLVVRDGAEITTDSLNFGSSRDINVSTTNAIFSGPGQVSAQSAFAGNSGNVKVQASGTIEIKDGFVIAANTFGSGESGSVEVSANGSVTISGIASGIASQTGSPPAATLDAFASLFLGAASTFSDLALALGLPADADLFAVLDGLNAFGLTAVSDLTPGNGGTITVTTPILTVSGAGSAIDSGTAWGGNAGNVQVNVRSVAVNDGAEIRSRSGILNLETGNLDVGTGNAGRVTVVANGTNSITISGPNSAISTTTFGDGNAGDISLSANHVTVQNGGSVSSATGGTVNGQLFVGGGNAGQITVSTPKLIMADGGTISVATAGAGNAGSIALNVGDLTQTAGSRIDSSTAGAGQGGDLTVTAANSVSISGTGTGLFSTASGSGAGGNINVQGGQLVQLTNDATLSAQSTGTATATAGNITINTPNLETQNANVTTGAALADGGNIAITTTGSLVHLSDTQVTTSVQSGVGSGGNIAINSELIVLDDSQVLANAFGGPGGNITITGDVFLVNSGGQAPTSLAGIVQASSALSTPGTINIEATVTDVSGTVAQLPEAPLQATELLRAACAARFVGGKTSSLVLGGRDGLPLQPGSLLPSPPYLASTSDTPSTISNSTGFPSPTGFSLLGSSDRNSNRYSLLPNFKCSL
jgi:large exoprotein involved in heme utilization and adhesion